MSRWRCVVVTFRSCSGTMFVRLVTLYYVNRIIRLNILITIISVKSIINIISIISLIIVSIGELPDAEEH